MSWHDSWLFGDAVHRGRRARAQGRRAQLVGNIYSYRRYDGREIDLTNLLSAGYTKAQVAKIARDKGRLNDLAGSVKSMKSAGFTDAEINRVVQGILRGRSLASLVDVY